MKHLNIDMIMFLMSLLIGAIGLIIIEEFIHETISWVMLKLIIVEAGLLLSWLWLSQQEQK